jgi:PAS domain S-box-containing protein
MVTPRTCPTCASPADEQAASREIALEQTIESLRQSLAQAEAARRDAEERLRDVQDRLESALDAGAVASWVWDIQADRVFADRNLARLFSVPPEVACGGPLAAYLPTIHAQDRERVTASIARSVEARGPYEEEYRIIQPDGSSRWVVARGRVISDSVGRAVRMPGVLFDVTDRKIAEETLRQSEEYHRLIADLTADYAYRCTFGPDGMYRTVFVTEGFTRFTGYSLEDLWALGDWPALLHPDDIVPSVRTPGPVLFRDRQVNEVRVRTKAGPYRWVRYSIHPLHNPEGQVVGLIGAVMDIDAEKRAQEQLQESEERLRRFFDAAFEGLVFHEQGHVLDANPAAEALYGLASGEMVGRHVLEFAPESVHELIRGRIRAGSEEPYEALGLRKTGALFPVEMRSRNICTAGQRVRVTAWKEAEQQLQDQAARLRALSSRLLEVQEEERRHLARELHDDLGQILTGLLLSLQLALSRAPDDLRPALSGALTLGQDLMAHVRALSRGLRPALLEDEGLIPALRWLFDRIDVQTGVRVHFEDGGFDRRLRPTAEIAVYRIVQESVTNVARHAGVKEAKVCLSLAQDRLVVEVTDRGRGFVNGASDSAGGLAGMAERASLLGGRLEINSRPGEGTRLTAHIPLVVQEENGAAHR